MKLCKLTDKEEEILWKAMEHESELRDLVSADYSSEVEKIKAVRTWLREQLPEVLELPDGPPSPVCPLLRLTADFKIARWIISFLSQYLSSSTPIGGVL